MPIVLSFAWRECERERVHLLGHHHHHNLYVYVLHLKSSAVSQLYVSMTLSVNELSMEWKKKTTTLELKWNERQKIRHQKPNNKKRAAKIIIVIIIINAHEH